MKLADLPTPALVLDRSVVARNTARMASRAQKAGVRLRPHMKTAKSARVAELATDGQFGGITVSTLAEARYFAAAGIRDITYAVGMVPAKLPQAAAIQRQGNIRLALVTDDAAAARDLAAAAADLSETFDVLIEIDCGAHRAGVAPEAEALVEIGGVLDQADHLRLAGVLTHAGHSYHCASTAEVKEIAEAERAAAVQAAERLRSAGLPCETVSIGSTPTAVHADSFDGVTEIRPGVYMFFDLDQFGLGSCAVEDIGISVLASVIGHQQAYNRVNIDAGSLALSQDRSAEEFLAQTGYGWVMDANGQDRIGDLYVSSVNQEHGMVSGAAGLPFGALPIGSRVRVLPNHACITAAAYDRYYVVDGGDDVIDVWDRINGW